METNVMIPTRDGTRLAAELSRPDGDGQFPVIIEYYPYRKDDVSQHYFGWHHYFAQRGFIGAQVDVRGTGGSEGISPDEYTRQEQEDGYDVVEWFARQPWSNGKVGMFGTSYGGFTAIQVAMQQPPHLKAIVPLYATDDRYTDDCHYTGGGNMRMYYDVGCYGGMMVAMNALPPYPKFAGLTWAEMWKQRLEESEPYILKWMKHQVDGAYWRQGSLRPAYDRIQCPVFLIAGWHDGYVNAMLRTYTHLKVSKKLMVGPWVHTRPHASVPGPRIDFFNEVARFFAHWLRDEDTGIMQEPAAMFYMQEYAKPDRTLDIIPGQWRNDEDFPVTGTKELTFYLLESGILSGQPGLGQQREYDEYEYFPNVGLRSGYWSGGMMSYYLADDQRADEAYSLVFTTPPFREETHILGWPQVILHASSSAKITTFVAKLADVAPDGSSALISGGSLNGTRRESLSNPTPMTPNEIYELKIPTVPTGWVLKPGHRLRLAISGSDFPNLWPTPESARVRVYRDRLYPSRVILPGAPESDLPRPQFLPPPQLRKVGERYSGPETQQVVYDQMKGTATVVREAGGDIVLDGNLGTLHFEHDFRCSASSHDPTQASVVGLHKYALEREDGVIEVAAETSIRATETAFHIMISLNVTRNARLFFHKEWTTSEPRQLL
jgi:putative CocE/NonD family hydrolase